MLPGLPSALSLQHVPDAFSQGGQAFFCKESDSKCVTLCGHASLLPVLSSGSVVPETVHT